MNLLLTVVRAALAHRLLAQAKQTVQAAARRGAVVGALALASLVAAVGAVGFAAAAATMALAERMPLPYAALIVAGAFALLAAILALTARARLGADAPQPAPAPAPPPTPAPIAQIADLLKGLKPETTEALIAGGAAIVLGLIAARRFGGEAKPPDPKD